LLRDDLVSTSVRYRHGIAVLAISGEIDIASAATVEQAIAEVLAEDPPSLIIDLLGVHFLASAGVGIMVKTRDKFVDCQRFSVVAQGRMTRRVIELLDLDRVLSLQETVEEALSAAKARQAPVAPPLPFPSQPADC
jgi:anti-sigma B factor antagonist